MSKKSIIILILILGGALIVGFFIMEHLSLKARVKAAREYFERETTPYSDMSKQELRDTYMIYNGDKNDEMGTKGVVYYPCPMGYDCIELLHDNIGFSPDRFTFDHCNETEKGCMDVIKDFLKLSGVGDVEAYLLERRLPYQ